MLKRFLSNKIHDFKVGSNKQKFDFNSMRISNTEPSSVILSQAKYS